MAPSFAVFPSSPGEGRGEGHYMASAHPLIPTVSPTGGKGVRYSERVVIFASIPRGCQASLKVQGVLKFEYKTQPSVASPDFARIPGEVPTPGGRCCRLTPRRIEYSAT